jgi:UDP-N-acetylmuramate dehydrogenase
VEDSSNFAKASNLGSFDASLIPQVNALVSGRIRQGVSAASLTTLAIGGDLRAVVTVESETELQQVRKLLAAEGQPCQVLGFGSNLLVSDAGLDSWVIKLGSEFRAVESRGDGRFHLGGAVSLMTVARRLSGEGFAGLEFAAGIPASIGGAAFMNAGAHGSEIGERIVSVRGVIADGQMQQWARDDLLWNYRCSGLPTGVTVTSIEVQLVPGDRDIIAKACADNLAHRRRTQPLALPSAGSVFKNPTPDLSAGKVLELAGAKGLRVGGAVVSDLHANWIVNPDKRASAADVLELVNICTVRASEQCGVRLEPEVRMWGSLQHL